jgi:hypothetical protein
LFTSGARYRRNKIRPRRDRPNFGAFLLEKGKPISLSRNEFGEMAISWYHGRVTKSAGADMVSIQIDEQTAKALEAAATDAGVSISEFLKLILPPAKQPRDTPWDSLEREFAALSVDGSLPENFSRVDIYADHD